MREAQGVTELQDPMADGPERGIAISASTTAGQSIPVDYTWKQKGIGPTAKNPETKQKPDRKPSYVLPQDPGLSRSHGGAEEFAPQNTFTEKNPGMCLQSWSDACFHKTEPK